MKGIYLTPEAKAEIEAKIAELEDWSEHNQKVGEFDCEGIMISEFKQILASATILPVEERWHDVKNESLFTKVEEKYPNGVIIQPK